ncbi:MAG: undecaprenyl/decaprenyl-phosphate alpha-N-acetylglucosaminyl 1-phosphate transferase [Candidatus Krumholzibacteriota bacterium]|nr:undecaprenyl/decaprenyl-phosphate alpha-N-acetylglucosaminyl 1-phosphate transferase [Candidatus Krumholzibacteriota bacterium]
MSDPIRLAAAASAALVLALALGRAAMALAGRWRLLDPPGARKLQERPVPLMGGVAVFLAVLAGLAMHPGPGLLVAGGGLLGRWLLGGLVLVAVGLADDRGGLRPGPRLAAQVLAALLLWPELVAWTKPAGLALPVGLLWTLGLVNSLNLLDNMDAAAGATAFWTALALAVVLAWAGAGVPAAASVVLAAALAGFLWWNRPRARLYLGDAGSTFLGYSLALLSLLAVGRARMDPLLAPLLLAVPLYDTATVCWIRWREGRPLYVGDRCHVTHRLAARGLPVGGVVLALNAFTLAAAAAALALHRLGWPGWPGLAAALALAVCLFALERRRRGA